MTREVFVKAFDLRLNLKLFSHVYNLYLMKIFCILVRIFFLQYQDLNSGPCAC
jgi:hypothetical protein